MGFRSGRVVWACFTHVAGGMVGVAGLLVIGSGLMAGDRPAAPSPAPQRSTPIDFSRDVLPILSDNCFACHGPDERARKAKLRLDTPEGVFRESDGVTVVKAGHSDQSELCRRILSDDPDEQMPPAGGVRKLTDAQKQVLKRWVDEGAHWGMHWAFRPIERPALPPVGNADWPRQELDRFIMARLEKEGLKPAAEADRERLIRRVSFDLTGLPPTSAQIDAFLADRSPDAYEKLVDRLLASPRYGERMASDWLDIARFADTHGYQMDRYRPMWAYRDWVIKAFNENLSFDQFLTWQLAGDLMPNATKDQRLATAFNRLHSQNEEGGIVEEEFRVAYVVDRVDTMGTAFMGMTFECSRCHDHKYDPISQKDFYQLFSFFQNIDESGQTTFFTDAMPVPTMLLSTDEQDAKLAELQAAIDAKADAYAAAKRQADGKPFERWLAVAREESRPAEPERRTAQHGVAGCVGRFSFDEFRKEQVENSADAQTPGKLSDAPVLVDGVHGKDAKLSGENGFTFPGLGNFSRSDAFSLAIRLRDVEQPERAVIVHKSKAPIDAGSRGYELLLEGGHVAFGLHHMWPGNSLKVRTKQAIARGAWAHVAVTYDGSSHASGVRIYVDGKLAELDVIRDGLWKDILYGENGTKKQSGEPDLAIGFRFRDSGFKNGEVDDFAVFDRELSGPEVKSLAATGAEVVPAVTIDADASQDDLEEYFVSAISPEVREARDVLRAARKAQADYIENIPEAMVMTELPNPKPAYVLNRGSYDQHGAEVSADVPHFLPPLRPEEPHNRLGLAHWLTDPGNPLTARVTVNRLWQQMFGRGIVETTDNFGATGAVPSHPDLLDYLARVFVDDLHWDQKAFLKLLATSATYRQSSLASAEAQTQDPADQFLSHAPARRLTAEMLRDQALTVSGLVVEQLGGPSVKPYQPKGLWDIAMGRPTYDQSQGPDLYRRSLYTFIKRTVAPPAMMTFDAADRSYCTVRRQSTSTPLQSLTLLNDVQIVEASRKLAERMIREGGDSDDGRVRWAFRAVTSRHATDAEARVLAAMLAEQRQNYQQHPDSARQLLSVGQSPADPSLNPVDVAAGCMLGQALFNHDEAMMRR